MQSRFITNHHHLGESKIVTLRYTFVRQSEMHIDHEPLSYARYIVKITPTAILHTRYIPHAHVPQLVSTQ